MMLRGTLATIFAALTVLATMTGAGAQDYPNRAITLVVPFPPGGSTSIVARIVAEKMSEGLGQQVVVDNRGGAGGTIGSRAVARSAPDGYTLLLGYTGTLAIGPSLYPNVGYDPRKDFAPIGLIGHAPNSLVVHPSFPAKSVKELVDYAKSNPGKVQYGSAGVGTVSHVSGVYFAMSAGIQLAHVPYRGTGPAIADLVGGHIPVAFAPIPATHSNIDSGRLRGLAVTSKQRSSLVPNIPTIAEAGVKDFEASLYYGLVAPPGTPKPIIDRLNKELRAALQSEDVRKRLVTDGAEPVPGSPEDYAKHIDEDERKWAQVVKASGAKAE